MSVTINGTTGITTPSAQMVSSPVLDGSVVPAFSVYRSATASYTSAVVIWDTKKFDVTNSYSTTTGLFTAPYTGIYQFNLILTGGPTGQTLGVCSLELNGALRTRDLFEGNILGTNAELHSSAIVSLTAGDTIGIKATASVEGGNINYYAAFQGHLISRTA